MAPFIYLGMAFAVGMTMFCLAKPKANVSCVAATIQLLGALLCVFAASTIVLGVLIVFFGVRLER